MGTFGICALLAVFGAVCALFVSVFGFALSAVAILALLGLFGGRMGVGVTGWLLFGGLIALQVGYFVGLVGSALLGPARRVGAKDPRRLRGDLHVKHD